MNSNQAPTIAQHDAASWAQSAEEARLARLRQLEVTQSYESENDLLSPPFLRHAATTGTNSISVTNPRFNRELSDGFPRIKCEPSDDKDNMGALEDSLLFRRASPLSQHAHRAHQTQEQQPNNANLSLELAQIHARSRPRKKTKGNKPSSTNPGPQQASALIVRAKLAAHRKQSDKPQASTAAAPKQSAKIVNKATARKARRQKKGPKGRQATCSPASDNETVDEEVPHRGILPPPVNAYQTYGPGTPFNWAAPALAPGPFGVQNGYAPAPFAAQQGYPVPAYTPQAYPAPAYRPPPTFFPQQSPRTPHPSQSLSQHPYFSAPTYANHPPTQPSHWQLTHQTPAPQMLVHDPWRPMPVSVPMAYTFAMERCQYCNVDIMGIERDTGFGFAPVCPVCGGARGYYSQVGHWQRQWQWGGG